MKPRVNVVLLGKGNVGKAWLELFPQIQANFDAIADVKLVAVTNSTKALIVKEGLSTLQVSDFENTAKPMALHGVIEIIAEYALDNVVIFDLTASLTVAKAYVDFAQHGWNVISANKLPITQSTERHKYLVSELKNKQCYWGINATVGAALPVQTSISELLQAGDKLSSIEGVFSGSLCYLLTKYDGKQSFTELVREACKAGVTEPDPREDLSGADVSRKLLILARISGYQLDLEQINTTPLLPSELMDGSLEEFWSRKEQIDFYMAEQYANAEQQGRKLVYKADAKFMNKVVEGTVSLEYENASSAMAQLTPKDNIFVVTTDFYQQNPLIIRGPGAGTLVTASAVNIDFNKFVIQVAICRERK